MLSKENEAILKKEWDKQTDRFPEFWTLSAKRTNGDLDVVDKMQLAVKLSKIISSKQLDRPDFPDSEQDRHRP